MDKAMRYCGIYDFELLPYALGDALTWNVQTALRCLEAGRRVVDAYICIDPNHPSSIYQRGLVTSENCALFFNELFGAFGTHPLLGNIHLYASREEMLVRLREVSNDDPVNTEVLEDYERVLGQRDNADALNSYFIKYIYSHARLNRYHDEHGRIPLLVASRGCGPDIDGLMAGPFAGKRVVVIHPRLRRLDNGLAGDHTYSRDSDFLEWFEFVRLAEANHPEVQFVVMGRLQEKPLELLRRPNVTSLRALGLGLGHELTLMLRSDLFIGTSSGFAAMANFCEIPYFVTHMNPESCNAYAIPNGAERLPFAAPHQFLVYERESRVLLETLLERGLALPARNIAPAVQRKDVVDVRSFERDRAAMLAPHASTSRFFIDDTYADQETAFLLWPRVQSGFDAAVQGDEANARAVAQRVAHNFPRLPEKFSELAGLSEGIVPPPRQLAKDRLKRRLVHLMDGNILPHSLRGTAIHAIGRRLKDAVLGYRRR
ncbi:hypothetical protein [Bosea sp. 124]|uniref:hypothetical protein n=1 Tax=Bosea sp. 124 TaxID=2135642 RepID=UPI000D34D284|nr:hypothetical protein [Bosea sp. 124]PTM40338.1 hypothetical protein C8D03_1854 [Bosea sp. 124]